MTTNRKSTATGYCSGSIRTVFFAASVAGLAMLAAPAASAVQGCVRGSGCELELVKHVASQDPSITNLLDPNNWTLRADGPDSGVISGQSNSDYFSGNGDVSGTALQAGTWTLSESSSTFGSNNYQASSWTCDIHIVRHGLPATVTIDLGDSSQLDWGNLGQGAAYVDADGAALGLNDFKNVVCTITNTYVLPCASLTLNKSVIDNCDGQTTPLATDFLLTAQNDASPGSGDFVTFSGTSGVNNQSGENGSNIYPFLPSGKYYINESDNSPSQFLGRGLYRSIGWYCVDENNDEVNVHHDYHGSYIYVQALQQITCTITNAPLPVILKTAPELCFEPGADIAFVVSITNAPDTSPFSTNTLVFMDNLSEHMYNPTIGNITSNWSYGPGSQNYLNLQVDHCEFDLANQDWDSNAVRCWAKHLNSCETRNFPISAQTPAACESVGVSNLASLFMRDPTCADNDWHTLVYVSQSEAAIECHGSCAGATTGGSSGGSSGSSSGSSSSSGTPTTSQSSSGQPAQSGSTGTTTTSAGAGTTVSGGCDSVGTAGGLGNLFAMMLLAVSLVGMRVRRAVKARK